MNAKESGEVVYNLANLINKPKEEWTDKDFSLAKGCILLLLEDLEKISNKEKFG